MSNETNTATISTIPNLEIVPDTYSGYGYNVRRVDGTRLTNRLGAVRIFATRNSARKRISRERVGNFHK
jgi:hypothetical protein